MLQTFLELYRQAGFNGAHYIGVRPPDFGMLGFWILGFWENWKKIPKVVFALVRSRNKKKKEEENVHLKGLAVVNRLTVSSSSAFLLLPDLTRAKTTIVISFQFSQNPKIQNPKILKSQISKYQNHTGRGFDQRLALFPNMFPF